MTEEACLDTCTGGGPGEVTTSASPTTNVKSEVCAQEVEPGNCSASSIRYYFSPETGSCLAFSFSGCQVITEIVKLKAQ